MKKFFIITLLTVFLSPLYSFEDNIVSIGFTGDIMMHNNVKKYARISSRIDNNKGFDLLFEKLKPTLKNFDILCGNMEFPIRPPFRSNGIVFNSPPEIVDSLKYNGFDILNLANNHIVDQYSKGVIYTTNLLDQKNIPYIGVHQNSLAARNGKIIERNGIKIGFLAYTGLINYGARLKSDKYYINWLYRLEILEKDIKNAKSKCDYLILQAHDGTEYVLNSNTKKQALYRKIAEMGVDLIIGHHPHTIQQMEEYTTSDGRKVPIFYSLGNFISDQRRSVNINSERSISIKSSFIVELLLKKSRNKIIQNYEIIPIYTLNSPVYSKKRSYRKIQVAEISKEIELLKSQLLKQKSAKRSNQIKSQIKQLEYQAESIKQVLFRNKIPENITFKEN